MNIVENKHVKFDIDTVEGAEKYLESEGVNVAEYLQKGIEELKNNTMNEREVHLKLSEVKIDNDNLDYIKMTGEICGKLRDDIVKLFAMTDVTGECEHPYRSLSEDKSLSPI